MPRSRSAPLTDQLLPILALWMDSKHKLLKRVAVCGVPASQGARAEGRLVDEEARKRLEERAKEKTRNDKRKSRRVRESNEGK